MRPIRALAYAAGLIACAAIVPRAQMRVVPLDDEQGRVALGLALRHLANTGTLTMATAHPDDENNGLLVMLNRGQGYRTALATATRGNGGQNAMAGGANGMPGEGNGGTRGSDAFERGGGDRTTQPADQPASFRRGENQQGTQPRGGRQTRTEGEGQQARGGERQFGNRGDGGGQAGQAGERQFGQSGGGRGGQQMTPEERQKRMQERLAQMTPEQRAQFEERMKQFAQGGGRGQGSGRQGSGGEPGQGQGFSGQRAQGGQPGEGGRTGGSRNRPAANESGPSEGIAERGFSTIDALFGELTFTDMPARVWVYSVDGTKKSLKSINIRYRIDDGTMAELVTGEGIQEGMRLVSTIDLGTSSGTVRPNSSPLMPGGQRGGPGGFGGPGGGGRGR
jgi:hypothetical protein